MSLDTLVPLPWCLLGPLSLSHGVSCKINSEPLTHPQTASFRSFRKDHFPYRNRYHSTDVLLCV